MLLVYIILFLLWSYICFYVGERLERAVEHDERLSDIDRVDSIINCASVEFDKLYKNKSNK